MFQSRARFLILMLVCLVCGAIQASAQTSIYNNIPSPLPGNLASQPFEAQGTSEFGDRIGFAPSTPRKLTSATVTMSSWGCESGHWYSNNCVTTPGATFSHPITLNIYAVGAGNTPGALLGTVTQTFAIPYRPSADFTHCTDGTWYDASSATCFNGLATNITFDLSSLNLTAPNQIIFGVAFNTSDYGYTPLGHSTACSSSSGGCGYDSLNVAVSDLATSLTKGTNPSPNDAYQYTIYGSCSGAPIIPFGLDAGCWTGYKPSVRFNASFTKDDCKNNGWKNLTDANGKPFQNQGQCVSNNNNGK